ncbi:BTAD domain-containing putative transcriptional regulator [Actinomycetes bacterium KLBMP 9797]
MEFRVLGPMMVIDNGCALSLGPPRQRLLLALLLGRAGATVTMDALVDALWSRPPASAVDNVYLYVHRLRAVVGKDRLTRQQSGYALAIRPGELDAERFAAAVRVGGDALAAGDAATAGARLREALGAWRGRPYGDLADEPAIGIEVARLEELRLTAIEQRVEADLSLGPPDDLVGELLELVQRHPYRERLTGQLMRALHRQGRQTEALAAFRRTRAVLREQLGLEPGADLQRLELAILSGDQDLTGPVSVARVPSGIRPAHLPADVPYFTGRVTELTTLDALSAAAIARSAMVTVAIAGPAGVGKTALAVHWARRVADAFPDGQLYVNLRGFDPSGSAMSSTEAVRVFLDALEVPSDRIPDDLPAQINLYRSLLAHKRVLVMLDNARDAQQVRPLLPGGAGCVALVTSRSQLTGLVAADGAQPVDLDLLTIDEAREMLDRRLGLHRTAAEPDAVLHIIDHCARLPLALAIVAAHAMSRPTDPLQSWAAALRQARDGLEAFSSADPATDVRAVFSWSYQTLTPAAAALFRLLSLHPGPDFDTAAAASLAGVPVPAIRPLLAELIAAHLLTRRPYQRFGFHDLLRAYATELAHEFDSHRERRAATHRMLDHYLHTAYACDRLLSPQREPVTIAPPAPGTALEPISDYHAAMNWFATEHTVLMASIQRAADARFDAHPAQLAWATLNFFDRRGLWHDWIASQRTALSCARRSQDVGLRAQAHRALGRVYTYLNRYGDAELHLKAAIDGYHQINDGDGEAYAHVNFGILLGEHDRHSDALAHAEHARQLFRQTGNLVGEAHALNSIGWSLAQLGDHARALEHCHQALVQHQRLGNRHNEAMTLDSLGYAHHGLGQHQEAIAYYRRALAIYDEFDSRYFAAETLVRLAESHDAAADATGARAVRRQAFDILDNLGHASAERLRALLIPLIKASSP